jgi:hypothetical protein
MEVTFGCDFCASGFSEQCSSGLYVTTKQIHPLDSPNPQVSGLHLSVLNRRSYAQHETEKCSAPEHQEGCQGRAKEKNDRSFAEENTHGLG